MQRVPLQLFKPSTAAQLSKHGWRLQQGTMLECSPWNPATAATVCLQAPMLRSFSLLGKTSYLPLAEDSWLSEIRIGPLNKAENHNGVRVQGIK